MKAFFVGKHHKPPTWFGDWQTKVEVAAKAKAEAAAAEEKKDAEAPAPAPSVGRGLNFEDVALMKPRDETNPKTRTRTTFEIGDVVLVPAKGGRGAKATGNITQMLAKHAWVSTGGLRKKVELAKMEFASQPAAVSPAAAAKEEVLGVSGGAENNNDVSDTVNAATREAEAVVDGDADRSEEAEAVVLAWKGAEEVFG